MFFTWKAIYVNELTANDISHYSLISWIDGLQKPELSLVLFARLTFIVFDPFSSSCSFSQDVASNHSFDNLLYVSIYKMSLCPY